MAFIVTCQQPSDDTESADTVFHREFWTVVKVEFKKWRSSVPHPVTRDNLVYSSDDILVAILFS